MRLHSVPCKKTRLFVIFLCKIVFYELKYKPKGKENLSFLHHYFNIMLKGKDFAAKYSTLVKVQKASFST